MRRGAIEHAALAGLPLDGRDVARTSRSGSVLTLRHAWRDDEDGRVLDGVRRAWEALAHEIANRTGRSVEVYASGGWMVDQILPEDR